MRRQAHVVEDADRGHDEAELLGQGAAQGPDLIGQASAFQVVDQGQQRIAQLDLDLVNGQGGGDWLLDVILRLGADGIVRNGLWLQLGPSQPPGHEPRPGGKTEEGQDRHAGDHSQQGRGGGHHAQADRVGRQLGHQRLVRRTLDARLGDQEAGGDRDDDGRHLGHQTVADGQLDIGVGRISERQVMRNDPDQDSADGVDEDDDQARHRVAAHELGRTVHGPEEGRLLLQFLPSQLGLVLGDEARRQVGIDRHLLARHGIKGEAGRDLGDPCRALGDNHEVHHQDDGEDDHPDDEVAPHHQLTEGSDHLTGRIVALVAVGQHQPRRGQVQAEAKQGRDQQNGREDGEVQRPLHHQRRHQDQHGRDKAEREQQVQQEFGHRQDEQQDDADDADCHADLAAQQPAAHVRARRTRHTVLHHDGSIGHARPSAVRASRVASAITASFFGSSVAAW